MSSKIGHHIIELDTVESTNSYMLNLLVEDGLAEGTVIIAKEQLKGKGQRLSRWQSEKGKNVTLSVFLKPEIGINGHFILNKIISIAIVEFLKALHVEHLQIKWPNDIYVNDKKIAGILIESKIVGKEVASSVVGVGVNVNQIEFDNSVPNPTSVQLETTKELKLDECLPLLFQHVSSMYKKMKDGKEKEIDDKYESLLYRLNEYHEFDIQGKVSIAKILGVNELGRLILKTKTDELFACDMKEVAYRI